MHGCNLQFEEWVLTRKNGGGSAIDTHVTIEGTKESPLDTQQTKEIANKP